MNYIAGSLSRLLGAITGIIVRDQDDVNLVINKLTKEIESSAALSISDFNVRLTGRCSKTIH